MTELTGIPWAETPEVPQQHAPTGFPSAHSGAFFPFMKRRLNCDRESGPRRRGGIKLYRKGVWEIRWSHGVDPETGKGNMSYEAGYGKRCEVKVQQRNGIGILISLPLCLR